MFSPEDNEHGQKTRYGIRYVSKDHREVEGHGAIGQAGEALHRWEDSIGEGVGDSEQHKQEDVSWCPKCLSRWLLLHPHLHLLLRRWRPSVVQPVRLFFILCCCTTVRLLRWWWLWTLRWLWRSSRQSQETQSRDWEHHKQEPEEILGGKVLFQILWLHCAVHSFTLQLANTLSQRHNTREQGAETLTNEESTDILRWVPEHERQKGHVGRTANNR